MQENKNALLWIQGLQTLGTNLIGIFFIFFLKDIFGWSLIDCLIWYGSIFAGMAILVYPVNIFLLKYCTAKQMIGLGLILEILFYISLSFPQSSLWYLLIVNILYLLHLVTYWPVINYVSTLSTQQGGRGGFFATLQMILVGTKIITPFITGYLLDINAEYISLWLCIVCLGYSMIFAGKISTLEIKKHTLSSTTHIFKKIFMKKYRVGLFSYTFQIAAAQILWPLYFHFVVGSFTTMGAILSITNIAEMISSWYGGKKTDAHSAKILMKKASIARMIDISHRVLYAVFPSQWFIGIGSILSSILGPYFQIPAQTRQFEIAHENEEYLWDFYIAWEWYSCGIRAVFAIASAYCIFFFGEISMAYIIFLAGIVSLGCKKL